MADQTEAGITMPDTDVEVAQVRDGENLDWPKLNAYLTEHIDEVDGEPIVEQFPNGSANLTYRLTYPGITLVVRRPPFGTVAPGAHDMRREYKVLSHLHAHYPRAPRALLFSDDVEIVGAPFLVSEYRSGVVVWNSLPDEMTDADAGRRVGLAVVDALADLHSVDYEAAGLADLGKPEGYLARQVRGWTKRWDAVAADDAAIIGQVGEILAETLPAEGVGTIVHNDFKVDNCQFARTDPDRVISVFDWDMATLGDPLTDLGTLLNYWPDPANTTAMAIPGLDRLGLPTKAEVVERYAATRGVDLSVDDLRWYEAFGCWKTSIILQQLYARFLRGESTDPRMGERGRDVVPLGYRARDLLAG
ncbi:phosphotransferase family protein [Gordonia sp. GONU]|uniref:phosphotransferase family protein n=1 Tax=Gordonia sp. GONU TaxID=2972949 RepID=UPI0021AC0B94|nr:phosphotransferase family protein [Gordonia sp. GONU]MCR8899850.1 phosphotransferase family protein [Gordonia sp. GONU]